MHREGALDQADWADAVRAAVRSGLALRGCALLVHVSPRAAFHPLHALLPSLARDGAVVLVTQLHAHVASLLRRLHAVTIDDSAHRALLESLVFVDRAVDAASVQKARGRLAHATPLFCPRKVAVCGGAMCSFAADEAHAKAALADITRALQTGDDALDWLDADRKLVVLLEHDGGYVGEQLDGRVVARAIRVEMALFSATGAVTLDSVLEAYESDFRDLAEIRGADEQPQRLTVSVRAAFPVSTQQQPPPPPHGECMSAARESGGRVDALLLSSWGGIENVRSLGCRPPPSSSSLLCVGALALDIADAQRREASGAKRRAKTFQSQVRETAAFLATLESAHRAAPDLDDAQHAQLARKFGRFVSAPDAAEEDAVDLNNTLELNIALDFDRESDDRALHRADLDFLEKTWDFALANASRAEEAVALVRELVATFASARTAPFVHTSNATRLSKFFEARAEAAASGASEDSAERVRHMQLELSNREEALRALAELGEWKLRRDVAAWFVQIGFTAAESARVLEQFQGQQEQAGAMNRNHGDCMRAAIQQLVDVCALAHSLGASGLLLRKLANDFLGYWTRLDESRTEAGLPTFVVPLGSFIPERTRASLGDALFWDIEISFGDLMERTVRVCEATFHRKGLQFITESDKSEEATCAPPLDPKLLDQLRRRLPQELLARPEVLAFMQQAEEAHGDRLVSPAGVLQFDCTVSTLVR